MKKIVIYNIALTAALSIASVHNAFCQSVINPAGDFHAFRKSEQDKFVRFATMKQADDPEKVARQREFDVTYYGLDITVDPVTETIHGAVLIKARSEIDSLVSVVLDLYTNLTVSGVSGSNIASYNHENNLLTIYFTGYYHFGQTFDINVNYSGKPQSSGFGSFVFGERQGSFEPLIWTLSEPFYARTWWPCKDLPEDKADSAGIAVTVPENLTAVSNGTLTNIRNNGDGTRTFLWHEKYPITTYLISLAVSEYEYTVDYFHYSQTDSMPVEFYITPEKFAGAFGSSSGLPQTADMLEVFSALFGPYPFLDEKYAQVEFGWGGGMEHQTATSLYITSSGASDYLVSHELAHQWWGDMVTCRDWHHIWLNEGFATYSEGLYLEARDGKPALNSYMQSIKKPIGYWGSLYRENIDNLWDIFSNTVYDKGAWVLHMLRYVVGDDTFFDILRTYASEPFLTYGTAVTEDFQAVCETVYGESLDWYFSEWVYGVGRPYYKYSWTSMWVEDSYNVTVEIAQAQDGIIFTMPLEIYIQGLDKTEMFKEINNEVHQEYTFIVDNEPVSVTLDDSGKVLKKVKLISGGAGTDPNATPDLFTLYQNYPNPFNPKTTIEFQTKIPAYVTVKIYSIQGQEIKTLFSRQVIPGPYRMSWDGTNSAGVPVSGGIYFVRMTAESFDDVKKMALIR